METVCAFQWQGDCLDIIDQRLLPAETRWLACRDAEAVFHAIRDMAVRGAPAIGIAAAYGVVLAARKAPAVAWREAVREALEYLARSRPTAVNLFWALDRMERRLESLEGAGQASAIEALEAEARAIHAEDAAANHRMGALARDRMLRDAGEPFAIMTHCNTGALATGGYGTALGAIRSVWEAGWLERVYANETRPWLQGSRLTAWELAREGLPVVLNTEGAAAQILRQGRVRWVVVGADRVAANGDVVNKIGTYGLAVLARHHGVGFMVVAPVSTLDLSLQSGEAIPIEERDADEVRRFGDRLVAPAGVAAYNPVFDLTPAGLIDAIVTEAGVVDRPGPGKLAPLAQE